MKPTALFLTCLLFLTGCSLFDEDDVVLADPDLVGNWVYTKISYEYTWLDTIETIPYDTTENQKVDIYQSDRDWHYYLFQLEDEITRYRKGECRVEGSELIQSFVSVDSTHYRYFDYLIDTDTLMLTSLYFSVDTTIYRQYYLRIPDSHVDDLKIRCNY